MAEFLIVDTSSLIARLVEPETLKKMGAAPLGRADAADEQDRSAPHSTDSD